VLALLYVNVYVVCTLSSTLDMRQYKAHIITRNLSVADAQHRILANETEVYACDGPLWNNEILLFGAVSTTHQFTNDDSLRSDA
jgi:hypothetical protein